MKAMVLDSLCDLTKNRRPLRLADTPVPAVSEHDVLLRVSACGVCHTELDEIEGRTPPAFLPIILGHQIVGTVERAGRQARRFKTGDRAGVAWINSACGVCRFCREGRENLCDRFTATGRDVHGGYAEYAVVPETFAYPIPEDYSDVEAAPLLCAGAIGYRSLRLAGVKDGDAVGLFGFGASGHLVLQMVRFLYPGSRIHVFSRTMQERSFAMELGAFWAGDFDDAPPEGLSSAIDTTPAWKPVAEALKRLDRGGRLVINAIRKEAGDQSALLQLDYARDLWMEKEVRSVANLTRQDVEEFLALAVCMGLRPEVQEYALEEANEALMELKERKIRGAKVLRIRG
jgi:propanol-preferring alcohol dehydrogenase